MNYTPGFFKDKKITVMGLGLLGGIGDIRFLASEGADLIVTDTKLEADLEPSLQQLKEFPNIKYTLGSHDLTDFRDRDLIIKAPSTPLDSPFINEAKKQGIPVTMWAALFCRFARQKGIKIVGITGTRGKTTTTALICAILREAGRKVIEGGNVKGTSILSRLPELIGDEIVVLELDSWKLQGFGEEKISPDIAVFTNFLPDHQNYYKGDMDAYLADKANIFLFQKENDRLIVGDQAWPIIEKKYDGRIQSTVSVVRSKVLDSRWKVKLPGEHNRSNMSLARNVAYALDIADGVVQKVFENFTSVEGRLQFVKEREGVKIYNDTTSTTPDAALVGLEALAKDKNVVLIMGGADKQLSMTKLVESLDFYCKKIILLPGTGTDKLKEFGIDGIVAPIERVASLEEAVMKAKGSTRPGDIILFSPAFASFGMFKNEYDRGEKFLKLLGA